MTWLIHSIIFIPGFHLNSRRKSFKALQLDIKIRLSWACRKQISRPLFYLKVKGKGSVQALAHNGRLAWVFPDVVNGIHHIKEYVYSRSGELVMRKGLAATVLSSHSLSSGERHPDIYSQCVPAAQSQYGIV